MGQFCNSLGLLCLICFQDAGKVWKWQEGSSRTIFLQWLTDLPALTKMQGSPPNAKKTCLLLILAGLLGIWVKQVAAYENRSSRCERIKLQKMGAGTFMAAAQAEDRDYLSRQDPLANSLLFQHKQCRLCFYVAVNHPRYVFIFACTWNQHF